MIATLPADPRPISEAWADLEAMTSGNAPLRLRCYALIGALVLKGAPVTGAVAYALACIADGLTEAALTEVTP